MLNKNGGRKQGKKITVKFNLDKKKGEKAADYDGCSICRGDHHPILNEVFLIQFAC